MHRKLEEDLKNSKKKLAELVEQCDALKKGREESVSIQGFHILLCSVIELQVIVGLVILIFLLVLG